MTVQNAHRGRPLASSRETLQEAAFELFLEQTFARTTIDQIASRAGVSRATFFNYFASKSDVLWVELDESLAILTGALQAADAATPPMTAVHAALLEVAAAFGSTRVPWALIHHELIGSQNELQASAMSRLSAHARVVRDFVAARMPHSPALATAASYATIGAAVAAARSWAEAGSGRGELAPYMSAALEPVCRGFA